MTLNISEANALNQVITHLAGMRKTDSGEPIVSRAQAIDALALLARGAVKALHAGYTQTQAHELLTEQWREAEETYRWAEITTRRTGCTMIPLTGVHGHEAVLVLEGDQSGQLARMLVDDPIDEAKRARQHEAVADIQDLTAELFPELRHRPLTDETCGVIPTPRGRQLVDDYRAHRTEQHPDEHFDGCHPEDGEAPGNPEGYQPQQVEPCWHCGTPTTVGTCFCSHCRDEDDDDIPQSAIYHCPKCKRWWAHMHLRVIKFTFNSDAASAD
jgi:hypothetical protein